MRILIHKCVLAALMLVFICMAETYAQNETHFIDLYDQVLSLSKQHNFIVKGAKILGDEQAINVQGTLQQQLQQLLEGYNHIIIEDDNAGIERLIILKKTSAHHSGQLVFPLTVKNKQFFINATIKGADNHWVEQELMIDTGANLIVLPLSMLDELQLSPAQLQSHMLQTVNGKAEALVGFLPALAIGNEVLEKVEVAFVEDNLLGRYSLLGMSFLSHYRFSIDDELNQLQLIKK